MPSEALSQVAARNYSHVLWYALKIGNYATHIRDANRISEHTRLDCNIRVFFHAKEICRLNI